MLRDNYTPLSRLVKVGAGMAAPYIAEGEVSVNVADLQHCSLLGGVVGALRGRSVLVATDDQISTAVLLLDLDGIADRIVLVPPGTKESDLIDICRVAKVESVIAHRLVAGFPARRHILLGPCTQLKEYVRDPRDHYRESSWVLCTSGTSGRPKLVEHTLGSLTGAIKGAPQIPQRIVWSTFYDIRRYGGLQILLRAFLAGAALVLRKPGSSLAEFLALAGKAAITHISGTPSHWRTVLMSSAASEIMPEYIRLSGEIADQSVLDGVRAMWPRATVVHAFASTEAGVAFEVRDGRAGFPPALLHTENNREVEILIRAGSLCVRSPRNGKYYLGDEAQPIAGPDGFVDTGDMVRLDGGRYYFAGRRDGTINVGGMKVHPEEVEDVLNRHPRVRVSAVWNRKSSVTGSVVVADVVLTDEQDQNIQTSSQIQDDILQFCAQVLPRYKVPAIINIVQNVRVDQTGKLHRSYV